MIRIARERIGDLFALARSESLDGHGALPHRYVHLARRIGMRFNLRLPQEYRSRYCRRCSSYWVEGRTVRTRLRQGCCVRTCLVCGSRRRVGLHPREPETLPDETYPKVSGQPQVPALVEDSDEGDDPDAGEEE
ncbi:MAG: ribonuclease P protein component 4 [Thermoplasmata archaeon]